MVQRAQRRSRPLLITFSGLDGSGKSTQIESLTELLRSHGCRVHRLAFWDNAVVLKQYREGFVHRVFRSEPGIGAPGKPVNRRDKNMRGWHLTLARHLLYLLDALHLRWVVMRECRTASDVILMDRYIYDELANLPLRNPASRAFVRAVSILVPRPDIAFLLDADPEAARMRKPEYPLEFMRECRGWYRQLASLLGSLTVIPPAPLPEAVQHVSAAACRALGLPDTKPAAQSPRSA